MVAGRLLRALMEVFLAKKGYTVNHIWQGSCCLECEADVSWCNSPPSLVLPPLGIKPRFLVAEARFEEIDNAIKRFLSAYRPIPVEWIEERNEIIEYLQGRNNANRLHSND